MAPAMYGQFLSKNLFETSRPSTVVTQSLPAWGSVCVREMISIMKWLRVVSWIKWLWSMDR